MQNNDLDVENLTYEQLEREAIIALRLVMIDKNAPAAARATAAKTLLDLVRSPGSRGAGSGGMESDPATLDLDAINRELSGLS